MRRIGVALVAWGVGLSAWMAPARVSATPPGAPNCRVFPANNVWHADISKLPVNKHSAAWLRSMSAGTTNLHPDFGPSGGFPYGIPYTVVGVAHPQTRFIWPARHQAGESASPSLPPIGARFRLKASFPIARFRADPQVVLRAMKKYGLILADNGSNWYFQGAAQRGWPIGFLDQLKSIPASAFVAVDESCLMIRPSSGRVRAHC